MWDSNSKHLEASRGTHTNMLKEMFYLKRREIARRALKRLHDVLHDLKWRECW